jgi:hypothetical protein
MSFPYNCFESIDNLRTSLLFSMAQDISAGLYYWLELRILCEKNVIFNGVL